MSEPIGSVLVTIEKLRNELDFERARVVAKARALDEANAETSRLRELVTRTAFELAQKAADSEADAATERARRKTAEAEIETERTRANMAEADRAFCNVTIAELKKEVFDVRTWLAAKAYELEETKSKLSLLEAENDIRKTRIAILEMIVEDLKKLRAR